MSSEISHSHRARSRDDDVIDDETKSSNSMYVMCERMRLFYYIAIELELETPLLTFYYFALSMVNFC